MRALLIVAVAAVAGCASTGVIPVDKDTYMVSQRSAQVGFGPAIEAKADVYREANDFCKKQSKKVETVNFENTNSGFARPGSAALQFKCVE